MFAPKNMLSHFLVLVAVAVLSATFIVWLVDGMVLNQQKLSSAMRESGIPESISGLIKSEVAKKSQDIPEAQAKETIDRVSEAITPDYVDQKITQVSGEIIKYVKEGDKNTDIVIDLSDFPQKLRSSGIEVDSEMEKALANPIHLNRSKTGNLEQIPENYKRLMLLKYIGIVVFIAVLVAEWFTAAKGQKLIRIGNIFLQVAIWFGLIALFVEIIVPRFKPETADLAVNNLTSSLVDMVNRLIFGSIVKFAVICGVLGGVLKASKYYLKPESRP